MPRPEHFRALADVLEIPISKLLGVDAESSLSKDESALLALFRSTDARGRNSILAIARLQQDVKDSASN